MCIGDRYQIGSALFEVSQPRVTCYRVGIRMNEPRMPALLTSSGRPGFYFRVLREGEVGAGDEIVKVGEAKEGMTITEINALLCVPKTLYVLIGGGNHLTSAHNDRAAMFCP